MARQHGGRQSGGMKSAGVCSSRISVCRCSSNKNVFQVTELVTKKDLLDRLRALQCWQRDGGVMIMGYEMYRILSAANKVNNEEWKKELKSALVDPGSETFSKHDAVTMPSVVCVVYY